MRFFSKLTVICNCCFLVAVVLWYLEFHKKHVGSNGKLIELSWLENTFVTLGYGAIIVNVLFLLICFIFTAFKVQLKVATWMIAFNILAFAGQVYFFFFN